MDIPIGTITHYFEHIGIAVVDVIRQRLRVGDTVVIHSELGSFSQTVLSLQIGHADVLEVEQGETCVMKTDRPVRPGDIIFLQ